MGEILQIIIGGWPGFKGLKFVDMVIMEKTSMRHVSGK